MAFSTKRSIDIHRSVLLQPKFWTLLAKVSFGVALNQQSKLQSISKLSNLKKLILFQKKYAIVNPWILQICGTDNSLLVNSAITCEILKIHYKIKPLKIKYTIAKNSIRSNTT